MAIAFALAGTLSGVFIFEIRVSSAAALAHEADGCSKAFATIAPRDEIENTLGWSNDPEQIDKAIRPLWASEHFSDPKTHDPKNFIYIIRSGNISGRYFNGVPVDPLKQTLRDVQAPNLISASVVGTRPNGRRFVGRYGAAQSGTVLILKIPPRSIHIAAPADTGRLTNSGSAAPAQKTLLHYERYYGMHSPEAMLDASVKRAEELKVGDRHYNEIIFVGSKDVEIVGLGVFGNVEQSHLDQGALLGVPVVQIHAP
ncbi:MAG: hypothetical protein J0L82_09835 [Deltaproteobacteria bacterium]|nr:hypothetical protein [Deltaproteobacteria bacterium]